ncbi:MAG: protein phosphatase [Planctomycetota bacterium]|jgi:protein phosphatase
MSPSAGPYDIIGDVHGCHDELCELLSKLGYRIRGDIVTPPDGRLAIFLGDLVDRGPKVVECTRLVMDMVEAGTAHCILGNHEWQMLTHMRGENDFPDWGLPETLEQLARAPESFTQRLRTFSEGLPITLSLDEGRLLVAHAGMPEDLQALDAETNESARWFALNGCRPEDGHHRARWAPSYRGETRVVYGHTPTDDPKWVNKTMCVDTGCVYGGELTALRYPELEVVSVASSFNYGWG